MNLAERLEKGELVHFPRCPFSFLSPDDLAFLREQKLAPFEKNISLDPENGRLTNQRIRQEHEGQRLVAILRDFASTASSWLAKEVPAYSQHWIRDRVTFRPEEEAMRRLRPSARNDALHLDAFPSRPSQGHRILRLFVNIHETDARVWATSETFPRILARYGQVVGLPATHEDWAERITARVLSIFQPGAERRSSYDHFMLRLHHFLKANNEFQERSPRKLWYFQPGACWLAFTDMLSYAELRGQYALEHSFFVAPESLMFPDLSPPNLVMQAVRGNYPIQAA